MTYRSERDAQARRLQASEIEAVFGAGPSATVTASSPVQVSFKRRRILSRELGQISLEAERDGTTVSSPPDRGPRIFTVGPTAGPDASNATSGQHPLTAQDESVPMPSPPKRRRNSALAPGELRHIVFEARPEARNTSDINPQAESHPESFSIGSEYEEVLRALVDVQVSLELARKASGFRIE